MTSTVDRCCAEMLAASMEFHRIVDVSHQGYMYDHLLRPVGDNRTRMTSRA
jgi:hypothetical protein